MSHPLCRRCRLVRVIPRSDQEGGRPTDGEGQSGDVQMFPTRRHRPRPRDQPRRRRRWISSDHGGEQSRSGDRQVGGRIADGPRQLDRDAVHGLVRGRGEKSCKSCT